MRFLNLILAIAVSSVLFSCKSYYDMVLKSNDVDLKYKAAHEYFNNGKFKRAADIFDNMNLLVQGLPQEDTVNYYHGLSNYRYGDFQAAETILAKFIEVYPRSAFFETAQYLRIKCLYEMTYRYELDQTPAKKAMAVMSEFMYENPGSEYYQICQEMMRELLDRQEKKSYESARIYYTMEDYKAARYALRNVLKENAENKFREDILYHIAMSAYKYADNSVKEKQKERFLDFIDDYFNFISEYPESKYRKELDGLYKKVDHYTETKTKENTEEI